MAKEEGRVISGEKTGNFYWGASTSAHQIEGANLNDWTEWEKETASRKMLKAKLEKWPDFILHNYPNPLQEENYISGKACDHYNRFREDFDIAKSLGHNAHRFSIEWSRIEPEEGKFNQQEIEHYREIIRALKERGLEPFVTLWHWPLPLWIARKGGWESSHTISFFARYAGKIALEFKNEVRFFITLNEPLLWASNAYRTGIFPPQKKDFFSMFKVVRNLARGHKESFKKLKEVNPSFQIGVTQNTGWFAFSPLRPVYNFLILWFQKKIRNEVDFIGIDYYRRISFFHKTNSNSDIGWEGFPEGLYLVLRYSWKKFKKPIFVLENGIADSRDLMRPDFIRQHVAAMEKALEHGVDVCGYFHWSLLDNFEWEKGFWPRFGLVEVDFKTQERKVRESAKIYTKIIADSKH